MLRFLNTDFTLYHLTKFKMHEWRSIIESISIKSQNYNKNMLKRNKKRKFEFTFYQEL